MNTQPTHAPNVRRVQTRWQIELVPVNAPKMPHTRIVSKRELDRRIQEMERGKYSRITIFGTI